MPTNKQIKKQQDKVKQRRMDKHESDLKRQQVKKQAVYEHRLNRIFREKKVPFRRDPVEIVEAERLARDMEIRSKLEHNMEILKALEEEMEKEEAARKGTNERLEEEGVVTLEDKMKAIHDQNVAAQKESSIGTFGGTADVVFTPNPGPSDV